MNQCCKEIYKGSRGFRGVYERCSRKASVERDGKPYCRQHDPVAIAERQKATSKRLDAQTKEHIARVRLEGAAPDMLAALEAVVSVADRNTAEFSLARAAIAKAKGE